MAKQLNVNMSVTADTSQAKQQLQQLQMQLQKIQTKPTKLFDDVNLKEASKAAAELQSHLRAAVNADTGKLDLTRFSSSLKMSGKTLDQYRQSLVKLGPEGQQAFLSIAQSIVAAEAPALRLTKRMNEFATTMKNTVRWQISSSVLHGFLGTINQAYGYAKSLDASLNSIRIVTGQTANQMADFAKEANRAAQALSTTTTSYTDAALIFYQQGLSDKAVKERTDAVIKMANVTGDAADKVSSYMTAIWNNFDDGSVSLEHYADVITALGASTASSSAEIAAGLEKFAAIADVTGLSYEYATSALATLVANTRQSADVVGTSLKTIFSRLESVKLGETLEDGVELTKYSEALQKIGVHILDASGEMRNLDDILDDTAEKWDTLTQAQKMATAQTVAGVRQYNNFISLMDNWDDMQTNLNTAKNAEGSLQEQADIYAESWEAARDRVRAAAQAIYKDLIDEDFFIEVDNGLTILLKGVDGFIEGLGGIKGLLGTIGGLFMQYFAKEMPATLNRLKENLMYISGASMQAAQNTQGQAVSGLMAMDSNTGNLEWDTQIQAAQKLSQIKSELLQKQGDLSKAERESYENQIQLTEESYNTLQAIAQTVEKRKEETAHMIDEMAKDASQKRIDNKETDSTGKAVTFTQNKQDIKAATDELKGYYKSLQQISSEGDRMKIQSKIWKQTETNVSSLKAKIISYVDQLKQAGKIDINNEKWKELDTLLKKDNVSITDLCNKLEEIGSQNGANGVASAFTAIEEGAGTSAQTLEELETNLNDVYMRLKELGLTDSDISILEQRFNSLSKTEENVEAGMRGLNGQLPQIKNHTVELSEVLTSFAGYLMSLSGTINSIKSLKDVWSDEDADAIEKISAAIGTLTSVLFLYTAIKRTASVLEGTAIGAAIAEVAAKNAQAVATGTATKAQIALNKAMAANPIGAVLTAITALIAGIVALVSWLSWLSKEDERNAQAARDAVDAYKQTSDELNELEGNLKTTRDRLKELYKLAEKGPLSITDQKELAQLEAENAALEAQIELKKQIQAAEYKELAQTAAEAIPKKGQYKNTLDADEFYTFNSSGSNIDYSGEYLSRLETARSEDEIDAIVQEMRDNQAYVDALTDNYNIIQQYEQDLALGVLNDLSSDEYNRRFEEYSQAEQDYDKGIFWNSYLNGGNVNLDEAAEGLKTSFNKDYATQLAKDYSEAMEYLPALLESNVGGIYDEAIAYYQDIVKRNYEATGNFEELALKAFQSSGVSIEDVNAIRTGVKTFDQLTSSEKESFEIFANAIGVSTDDLVNSLIGWDNELVYSASVADEVTEELSHTSAKAWELAQKLNDGDSISAEDYSELSAAQQSYFSLMLDGTYKLTGDAKEFYDLVHQQMISDTQSKMEALSNQNDLYKSFQNMDWDTLSSSANYTETKYNGSQLETKNYYNKNQVYDQLDFLDAMGQDTSDWRTDLEDGHSTVQTMDDIANAVQNCKAQYDGLSDAIEANEQTMYGLDLQIALSYDNFKDLKQALDDNIISAQAFTKASQELDEAERMDGLDSKEVQKYADYLLDTVPALEDNVEAAEDLAIQIKRMNQGIDKLANNWDDWSSILKNSSETSEEYAEAMIGMKDAVSDVLDISSEFVSNDFITEHLSEIEKAAKGDAEAIDALRDALAEDFILNVIVDNDLESQKDDILTGFAELQASIPDLEVGATLDDGEFLEKAQKLIEDCNMTVDQANALFDTLGFEANFATEEHEVHQRVPRYITKTEIIEESQTPDGHPLTTTATSTYQDGFDEFDGVMDVPAMSTNGKTPIIESITKKAPGSANNYSSSNSGGTKQPGGKSKSGGGSKAKEKSPKDLKVLDDEIERYHEIKELLEDIEAEVNKFSKAKDRAWGAGKIANINKEINALNKQKAALQEYQRQAKSYMSSDAAKAASYGWSIGADGNISNYDANMAAITAEYNAAVAAYNSTEAGSDAEKAAGKNVEAAQKKFDEAKKALQQYEESADLVRDLEQQIIDASYEIADLKLEAIEYTIELKLDFDERQLKLFEDIMKDFGDMADHALDKITEIEKCIGVIFDEMATNKNGISQMLGLAGVSGGTIANLINGGELSQGQVEEIAKKMQEENGDLNYDQIMSDIEGYMDKLIDLNDQLREYREQVFATLEAAIDEYIDDLDRANDKIAKITKLTQGYKDLIQSIGKANVDATGELTKALNKALEDEAKSAITAAKAKEDFAKTTLDDAKALYQTAVESGDEWAINRAEEVLKKAEDEYADALDESQAATQAFVDAVATSFKDSIEQVITDLDKNLGGLKHLREQFDQSKELDAQYIEDYTKIYELSKLTRQVQSSMDETDNIRAKKELLEFQKEINAYQEQGVQMSEYELEYLQKRYELKLAEIALQEAQNAKSQVSMVQDNEGNYSYVYTADDQAVADAQQNYEDKLYALQLLNGQYINELQNNIITMQEEMSAKLQEIADDETLSQEERMERIEETREYYLERLAFYDEQLALSLDNNKSLYENEWLDYHEKTGYKISANKDYVDSWEETSIAILTNVKTQGEYMNMLQEYLTQAANTARDCCQESINKLNEVGLTTNNLTIIVNGATAQLTSDAQAIATSAQMMSAQYQSSINQIMASVQAFTAQYASMITQSIANNQRLIASMQMVIQMAAAMAAALGAHTGGTGGIDPGSGNQGNNGPGSNTPGNGQDPGSASKTADAATIAGIAASIWMDGQKSGWGNDPIRSGKVTAEYNAATATAVQQYINQHGPNGDIYSQWAGNRDELKKYYASYDTGGYTGAWGTSEGKLAMLHQKELVLNATDTSNMLAIVDMVRDISSMIDLNAMSSMINTGLSAITASLNNEETLEQEVHITAEFPNATDKNEILEAFDNVINLAAQYANRK